jgi:hypothetical protein
MVACVTCELRMETQRQFMQHLTEDALSGIERTAISES